MATKDKLYTQNTQRDVKVRSDRGALRLQFSVKISQEYWGKRIYFKSVGLSNTPENWTRLGDICRLVQMDLDHPDAKFDPTLEKYLNPNRAKLIKAEKVLAVTLRHLWEDFCQWKLQSGQIRTTTYKTRYARTYKNWLEPWLDKPVGFDLVQNLAVSLINSDNYKPTLKKLLSQLKLMGERAVRLEKLNLNYFAELEHIHVKIPRKSLALEEQENYRAYSLKERDSIIKAFYASVEPEEKAIASLIEFLFLTGCRLGESFALTWGNIGKNGIIFDSSYSTETKELGATKTNVRRLFKTVGYTLLLELINRLKSNAFKTGNNDLVFLNLEGERVDRLLIDKLWRGKTSGKKFTPGVVTRLVDAGVISDYLKPSSTRHTFITIQARSGVDLPLLADSVGNSVDVIYKHYLGRDRQATLNDL